MHELGFPSPVKIIAKETMVYFFRSLFWLPASFAILTTPTTARQRPASVRVL